LTIIRRIGKLIYLRKVKTGSCYLKYSGGDWAKRPRKDWLSKLGKSYLLKGCWYKLKAKSNRQVGLSDEPIVAVKFL